MAMPLPDLTLLRELSLAAAPSGSEGAVATILRREFEAAGLEVADDRIGNLWTSSSPRAPLAVLAHMDEVGLVVRRIEDDGYLRVLRLGGIGRRSLAARRVDVLTPRGLVPGVIGVKSHHLTDPSEAQQLPALDDAYIDIGACSADDARAMGVEVGAKAVFSGEFVVLGADDGRTTHPDTVSGRISSKALDNRAGCLVLVELARRFAAMSSAIDIALVGTAREEFDLQGAPHAVRSLAPEVCVVVDATPASCAPDLTGYNDVRLGSGPALKLYDFHGRGPLAGYLASTHVVDLVERVANERHIPLQREAIVGLVTDASALVSLETPPMVICLSLPIRYTHSPVEVCDVSDLAGLIDLVAGVVEDIHRRGADGRLPRQARIGHVRGQEPWVADDLRESKEYPA